MVFLPDLQIGRLNGWLPIVIFYFLFGLFLLTCPKPIIKKLYRVTVQSKQEYVQSRIGKSFSLLGLALMVFSPLKLHTVDIWLGSFLYLLGYAVMFIALFEYRKTPVHEAVIGGIYQRSRNPQWVGLGLIFFGTAIMTGNGLALILFICGLFIYHYRILGEERACLTAYGKPYQKYLDSVPRYF